MNESASNRGYQFALSAIDRAIEPKFFFLLGSFIFALDCWVNYLVHKNLYTLGPGLTIATLDWGKFLVFLLAFSFLMAFAMKVMRYILEEIIQEPVFVLTYRLGLPWSSKSTSHTDSKRGVWEAIEIAQDRQDKLLYEIAKEAADRDSAQLKERSEIAQMAFSILVFMMLNRFAFGDFTSPTILRQLAAWSDSQGDGYVLMVFGLWSAIIYMWLFAAFISERSFTRVYVPDLKSDVETK